MELHCKCYAGNGPRTILSGTISSKPLWHLRHLTVWPTICPTTPVRVRHEPFAWFYRVCIPPSSRHSARRPSLFLFAAYFTTHGARILAHALISASGTTGRLFIDIFFSSVVAARFTTPVEMLVTAFNFLHWRLHLHSIPHRIHFSGAALLALGKTARTPCNLISTRRVPILAGSAGALFL